MATTLRLDPIRCDGYGMCAELLPEHVTLDEWGYPVVRPGAIPDHLLAHARRAVDVCPVLALRLQDGSMARRRQVGPQATATMSVTARAVASPSGAVRAAAILPGTAGMPAHRAIPAVPAISADRAPLGVDA